VQRVKISKCLTWRRHLVINCFVNVKDAISLIVKRGYFSFLDTFTIMVFTTVFFHDSAAFDKLEASGGMPTRLAFPILPSFHRRIRCTHANNVARRNESAAPNGFRVVRDLFRSASCQKSRCDLRTIAAEIPSNRRR